VRGGLNTNGATRYRGNLDLVVNVDTEAMDMWKGGRFFLYGEQFHGNSLTSRDVGDAQFFSNIDSTPLPENAFQMMEYWYEHSLADGDILIKIGKQDANADFAYTDLGSDFINSSFGNRCRTLVQGTNYRLHDSAARYSIHCQSEWKQSRCLGDWSTH
jgi:porin